MTIRISVSNPAEHQPNELRAVATFLNNLAADRESGRIVSTPAYRQVGDLTVATHNVPGAVAAPLVPSTTAAPGASGGASEEQDVGVSGAEDTSLADVNGVMWDDRIHSETKSKNKDGSWRQKRGVDPELVKQVIAEQQQPVEETPPPVPVVAEEETPPLPPVEETPPPVPTPAVADVKPADVIKFITTHKLDTATVNELLASMGTGLTKAADLFAKADQAPAALAMLETLVG